MLQDRLAVDGLEVEPEPALREVEDAHVRGEVALAVEERGVAALTVLDRLDVVGQLTLQVLGGIGAGDQHAGAVPAQESRLLAEGAVLPV